MSYTTQIASYWLKNRLTEALWMIIISAAVAVLVLFFGRVIFSMKITYLFAWKWSWIGGYAISFLYSLVWIWARYRFDHKLALHWGVEPEKVLKAGVKYKIFKTKKIEDLKRWKKDDFIMKYNISSMVNKVVKDL